jgi:hypothetical protein
MRPQVIETIAYGPVSAKDVVAFWLIDDGTPDRGNRRSVLDRTFQVRRLRCLLIRPRPSM